MELIWIGVAFLLGMAANLVRLPPLLGYLAGGFLLAGAGAGDSAILGTLAHYGVVFLLFSLGLHIRLRNMVRAEVLASSLVQFAVSAGVLAVAFSVVGLRASLGTGGVVMLGILLGVASTVVAAKGLEARRELASYHGRVAIGILIIEDFLLVGVLAFVGLGAPSPWAAALVLLPLVRPPLLRLLRAVQHDELQLLFGLLLALGGATLFRTVGLSEELGAFVAGVLLSGSRATDPIADRLWSLREAFLVAFFLQIGLAGLPDASGWLFAGALLFFLPFRVAIFFALLTAIGLRARTAFFAAASLASYSEFAIITGAAAARAGIIPDSMVVSLALAVALSFAFGSPFNRQAPAIYRRLRPFLARFERDVRHPDAQPETLGSARHVVVGMGRTGTAAYDFLHAQNVRVVGLDSDPGRLEDHRERGRRVAYGVADDEELWEDLDLERLEGVIITITDLDTRLRAARALRSHSYGGVISATRASSEEQRMLEEAGVTSVCHPLIEAGERLAEQTMTSHRMMPRTEPVATATIGLARERIQGAPCSHADMVREVTPSADGCEECLQEGSQWVHLRICMTCGHVGCCDSSPNRHASRHHSVTGHPIVRSHEHMEDWAWCFEDRVLI